MAKKIIGVILIIIGVIILSRDLPAIKNLTIPREKRIQEEERFQKELADKYPEAPPLFASKDALEKDVDQNYEVEIFVVSLVTLVGAGIGFGGLALFKYGRKESRHIDSLKDFN